MTAARFSTERASRWIRTARACSTLTITYQHIRRHRGVQASVYPEVGVMRAIRLHEHGGPDVLTLD